MRRRWCEAEAGSFDWKDVFTGRGIDVGCGDDPLPLDNCQRFDRPDGDANHLGSLLPAESFDYLHASQVLEHMHDPKVSLTSWLKVVKEGGYVIITVPDVVLYEGMRWPSVWNPDHKTTWSLHLKHSRCPKHVYVPDFLAFFRAAAETKLVRLLDCNYDYSVGTAIDQTLPEANGVEPWIEIVLRKHATHPAGHSSG